MTSPKLLINNLKPKKWYNNLFDEIVEDGAKYRERLTRKLLKWLRKR